jgi:hypothetical protein
MPKNFKGLIKDKGRVNFLSGVTCAKERLLIFFSTSKHFLFGERVPSKGRITKMVNDFDKQGCKKA